MVQSTPTNNHRGGNGLKTVALKVDDELHAQLTAVAQLEGITITELIRDAVVAHLKSKQEDGSLAARAQAVLDEIDREAAGKRDAISAMFGTKQPSAAKVRTRKATAKTPGGSASS